MHEHGLGSLLLLLLVAAASEALAAAPVDDRIFAAKGPGETASVLVVMREQADLSTAEAIADPNDRRQFVFDALRARAESSQRPLVERLARAGLRYRSFYLVNMLEVEADRSLAAELARRADVSAVEVADTGLTWDHPALKPHYRGFDGVSVSHDYNWHDAVHDATSENPCGSDSRVPCDDDHHANGHGTAASGLIVGDDLGESKIGVAPGAGLIACRNMDDGVGTPARYTECFEFFLAPTDLEGRNARPDLGAHVINNSWGCFDSEGCTDPNILKMVVENVRAAGIFVVASAGNYGRQGCGSVFDPPAIYEAAFSVGAITLDDAIADFSSRGPVVRDGSNRLKPDLVAPGVAVRTAARPTGYQLFQGTSAASPHVAGAVALLWSAAPGLRGRSAETADVLRRTATPLTSSQNCGSFPGSVVPNAVFGWGRIDVQTAVARSVPVERMPPKPPGRSGVPRVLRPRE